MDTVIIQNNFDNIHHKYQIWFPETRKGKMHIADFYVPEQARGHGVGRYLWHVIFKYIPKEIRQYIIISGKLSEVDSPKNNGNRRDALWKDLIGYGKSKHAVYIPQTSSKEGNFKGYFHDPWDENFKSHLIIEEIDNL